MAAILILFLATLAFFIDPAECTLTWTSTRKLAYNSTKSFKTPSLTNKSGAPSPSLLFTSSSTYDCLPYGCYTSILISSTPVNKANHDADINHSTRPIAMPTSTSPSFVPIQQVCCRLKIRMLDRDLLNNAQTRLFLEKFAADEDKFFQAISQAMQNLSFV